MLPGPAFRLRSELVFLGWGPGSSCDLGGSGQDAWAALPLVPAPPSPGAGEGCGGLGFSMTVLLCLQTFAGSCQGGLAWPGLGAGWRSHSPPFPWLCGRVLHPTPLRGSPGTSWRPAMPFAAGLPCWPLREFCRPHVPGRKLGLGPGGRQLLSAPGVFSGACGPWDRTVSSRCSCCFRLFSLSLGTPCESLCPQEPVGAGSCSGPLKPAPLLCPQPRCEARVPRSPR